MNWAIVGALLGITSILLMVERNGMRTTLQLSFRGDMRRETTFLAQHAQSACTPLVFVLVWQLDPERLRRATVLLVAVSATAVIGSILKRTLGRVRPNGDGAGTFLGPTWRHANWRESFPSNHSPTAVALSPVLAAFYPSAAATCWALALVTAALRYLQDAHWPSDIIAGVDMGYLVAHRTLAGFGMA